jgi:hypothetical protein
MLPTVYQQENYDRRHFLTVRSFKLLSWSPDWTSKTRGMISSTLMHMTFCNAFPKMKSTDQNKKKTDELEQQIRETLSIFLAFQWKIVQSVSSRM